MTITKTKLIILSLLLIICLPMDGIGFAKTETITITGSTVNARSGPGTDYEVVQRLKKGDIYTVIDTKSEWTQIELSDGEEAWVYNELISVNESSNKSEDNSNPEAPYAIVTASNLTVKNKPNAESKKVSTIQKGESYSIIDENNNWIKVKISDDESGWIPKWNAEIVSEEIETVDEGTVTVLYDNVPLRAEASLKSDVKKFAEKGKELKVTSIEGNMYKVKIGWFRKAYVAGWLVEASGDLPQLTKKGEYNSFENTLIVIDPGHGGNDSGTIGASGTYEKDLALYTASLLKDKLENAGATVILTRESDTYVSLEARVQIANAYRPDAFISIHYDSADQTEIQGITQYYYHSSQKGLAESINKSMNEYNISKNRGTHFGNYQVLRHNGYPSVLLELGYLSNPEEEATVTGPKFQEQITTAISEGLTDYFQ